MDKVSLGGDLKAVKYMGVLYFVRRVFINLGLTAFQVHIQIAIVGRLK